MLVLTISVFLGELNMLTRFIFFDVNGGDPLTINGVQALSHWIGHHIAKLGGNLFQRQLIGLRQKEIVYSESKQICPNKYEIESPFDGIKSNARSEA